MFALNSGKKPDVQTLYFAQIRVGADVRLLLVQCKICVINVRKIRNPCIENVTRFHSSCFNVTIIRTFQSNNNIALLVCTPAAVHE